MRPVATDRSRARAVAALAATALALAPLAADAEIVDGATVLARLQGWLDGTDDLSCRFEQTLVSGALGAGVSESGRLYLKRPGRMRWEYLRPEPKVAVLDGGAASLYLPRDRQLIRGDRSWGDSPLLALLGGGAPLGELFEVTLVGTPDDAGDGAYRLRMVPRSEPEGFEEVTVAVVPPEFSVAEAEVLDEAGNRMRYEFRALRRNRGVDDGLFVVDPPPGTEILEPS